VIQYNKKTGALCFYQALGNLPGEQIPAPGDGETAKWQDNKSRWMSPQATEAIGCTGCHDNGGFIRSEYLAQLATLPNALPNHILPNTASGFNNHDTPVRYVGLDYSTNRSWSIKTSLAPGDKGSSCTTCHRLAVPNRMAFGQINGTAAHFANVATAEDQCIGLSNEKCSKTHPHSTTSPIWMRPGQIVYNALAEASATKYHECAVAFFNSNFAVVPAGCDIQPLAEPLLPPPPLCPTEVRANTDLNLSTTTFKWTPPLDIDHLNIRRNGAVVPSGFLPFPDGRSILPATATSVTVPFDQDYLATYNICTVAKLEAQSCCAAAIRPTRTICTMVAKCRIHGREVLPTDTDDPKTWCSSIGGTKVRFRECTTGGL
jgi:hypothetical protein